MVILPFIAAFYTRNLWVSELSYREQPNVQFKYKLISIVNTAGGMFPIIVSVTQ